MALCPGWDSERTTEFISSPPKAGTLSASKSLNAAILAKKEAEQKAAEERKAKQEALEALNKPIELEHHASGWWATVDAGTFNTDMQVPDRQVGSKFASQFNVTGQSGIGTSLFNISRGQPLKQAATSPPLASSLSMPTGAHTSSPAAPVRPEEGKEGWWSQMDAGQLNADEAQVDPRRPRPSRLSMWVVPALSTGWCHWAAPRSACRNTRI